MSITLRQALAAVALTLALAFGLVLAGPMGTAHAAQTQISGMVSMELRTYNTFRTKTNAGGISFNGTVSKIEWMGTWGWGADARWVLGIRDKSGSQISRLEFKYPSGSGTFPGTTASGWAFAINTRVVAGLAWPAKDAYATFSGTLFY